MNFVEELKWRGMIHDIMPGTEELLEKETTKGYIGFDPTADSLAYRPYGAGYAAGSLSASGTCPDSPCGRRHGNDRRSFGKIRGKKSS